MGCLWTRSKQLEEARSVLGLETRELFNAFDEDGNGVLALSEITGVLKSAGINADERDVANLMNVYDADGDGKISYIEFQRVLRDQIQARAENLIALFKLYDVDKDHMISIHECITLFEDVGVEEETLKEYLDEYFPAKNSKIGFKAFCKIFSQFV